MKILIKFLLLLSLTSASCKAKEKEVKIVDPPSLALSCKSFKYQPEDAEDDPKLFTCEFPEFKIFVYKIPTMETQEYAESVYSWFKKNAFYGPEVHTLQGIFFDGSKVNGRSFGNYNPYYKLISIFPNNKELTDEYPISDEFAKRMGVDKVDPLTDYRFWIYAIHHEYNHHSSFFYGSDGNVTTNTFGGNVAHDLGIKPVGEKFLSFTGIDKRPEFNDHHKVDPIAPFSGGSPTVLWPNKFYPVSFNQYLWTKAELFARGLALYTFPVPEELQNEKSVNAYGSIIEDYWWYHYYKANIYETHKTNDKDRKPIQEPVDKHLDEWSEFMDNEWFNDDAKFGEVFNDYLGNIYLMSLHRTKDISLVNPADTSDKITFSQIEHISNLKYYWRPFDSRKAKHIKIESKILKSVGKIEKLNTKYQLMYKNKAVSQAFDLKDKDKIRLSYGDKYHIIASKENNKIYFELKENEKTP